MHPFLSEPPAPETRPFNPPPLLQAEAVRITLLGPKELASTWPAKPEPLGLVDHRLRWLMVLERGLRHQPYLIRATGTDGAITAELPLCHVQSLLFGRYLISLPYVNSSGVLGSCPAAMKSVVDRAVELARELDCRYLELRHEAIVDHPSLTKTYSEKVHLRLGLPRSVEELRAGLKSKVRNQVKKGESQNFSVAWGRQELLEDFYRVFSRNMRDLGTPVFGRSLFTAILEGFPNEAELCCVRDGRRPVAAALLIHGPAATEVPSASSLREENARNPNMFMYWQLLTRAVERGQRVFDFGRSTLDSPTYRFKKQWGAEAHPAHWQYHLRQGEIGSMRPDNPKYQRKIRLWQRLPVWCANLLGPRIVRGIP